MEETGFTRNEKRIFPRTPESFLVNRVATFLPGHKVVPSISAGEIVSCHSTSSGDRKLTCVGQFRDCSIQDWYHACNFVGWIL